MPANGQRCSKLCDSLLIKCIITYICTCTYVSIYMYI